MGKCPECFELFMISLDSKIEIDSKIFEEWIAHCIRKHVEGGIEPKMTKEQCIAAAYSKLRKGELTRQSDSDRMYSTALGEYIMLQDAEKPPKGWWDQCVETISKSGQGYTEEQIRNICGALWFKEGIKKLVK